MRLIVIWFLLLDKWLYASALMRDLEAIAEKGHRVICYFPTTGFKSRVERRDLIIEEIEVGRLVPILSHIWFCVAVVWRLIRQLGDTDVAVLGIDVVPFVLVPLRLWMYVKKRNRPRFVVRETSPPAESGGVRAYYIAFRYLALTLSRLSDMVFAISPMRAEEIEARFNVSVQVWPSSVDTGLFNPERYVSDRDNVRASLGVRKEVLLMYHGDLSHERGLDSLIRAIGLVCRERNDVALLLLGKGQAEQELQRVARSLRIDALLFHGPVSHADVPKFIAAADVGVVPLPDHPQWRQQVPIKLLEYLAMEKPVVVTNIPGHKWILEDRRFAFFCGRGQSAEIAAAVRECLKAGDFAAKTTNRRQLRQRIAARFSSDAIAGSVVNILAGLVRDNGGNGCARTGVSAIWGAKSPERPAHGESSGSGNTSNE